MSSRVLLIGIEPTTIDFTHPDFQAFPGLTAAKVQAGLDQDKASLLKDGYVADFCLFAIEDLAAKAADMLKATPYGVVLIGAGVRKPPSNFLVFEQLINVIHELAPKAKICFNTGPTDSIDAVRRWI
ncbi:hypothetical protein NLG97_g9820 [Lecanicillium saksenae]|uniref:Uncharacterized protein n=1 Tax=Lecanicillium saksenae TaxID=468837 RepID=A0ACC1QIW7_9HYPO|nr:hypothetical protein NLG97_g9820 [Lecanicillium saksenae]